MLTVSRNAACGAPEARSYLRSLLAIAAPMVAAVAVVLSALAPAATEAAPRTGPALTVGPVSGDVVVAVSGLVTVSGSGFRANREVRLEISGSVPVTVVADGVGKFAVNQQLAGSGPWVVEAWQLVRGDWRLVATTAYSAGSGGS